LLTFSAAYTTFNYSTIAISGTPASGPESGSTIPGGASSLFDIVATITATITNSGTVTASEVAQLYIGLPSSAPATPVRQLRGFQKLSVKAGDTATAKFDLRRKDLSYWDTSGKVWTLPKGTFVVEVGASSRDLRLSGKIEVA
jgi:beta-glucosidase